MSTAPAGPVIEHDCVGGLLVRGGEVLLGRRADDRDWLAGAWDLFGGHIVSGETAADALRRELHEELGIETGAIRALATLESPKGDWRLQVFAVDEWIGEPHNRQPHEHAELRWMPPAEAQAKLAHVHPMFAAAIAKASSPGR